MFPAVPVLIFRGRSTNVSRVVSVGPRGSQRQSKYRVWYRVKPLVVARVHVAGRFPVDEQLTAN